MTPMNREILWEMIDVADVAVRAASHLRQAKSGRVSSDVESVDRAIEFLSQAADGGRFMSTGQLDPETRTLKPLNWAVDIYLGLAGQPSAPPDYNKLAEYLAEILSRLQAVRQNPSAVKPNSLDESIQFFEGLGEMLSSEVNQQRSVDSFEMIR